MDSDVRHVVGLGTGRCGTSSLATLLDAQEGWSASHEALPHLSWVVDNAQLEARLASFRRDEMVRFADIAFYYLPYVRLIRERLPGTRFVCLQRDRSETVQSYVKWAAGRNFWQEHDGRKYREDPEWDRCYPKVDADSIEEAVGKYWDGYYEEAAVLHREFPGEFGVWRMEDVLNSERGMREVLEFCGIPHSEQVLPVGVRANSLSPFAAKVTAVKGRIKHVVQRLT